MGLTINQTFAQIGIDRVPGKLEIDFENSKLELRQKHAKLTIDTEFPKIEIDQYECFATAGLKNYLDLTKEAAQKGYTQVMNYIAKTAADGDRLMAIEAGGSPIEDIAERDAWPIHEFGLDFIPKARPRVSVEPGYVRIKPQQGTEDAVDCRYIPGYVRFNFTPTKIKVYLKQKASINFSYKGNKVDTYI